MVNHWLTRLKIVNYAIATLFLCILQCSSFAAESEVPKSGGELVVGLYSTPSNLNPAIQSGLATAFPGTQIFAGLLRFDNEWNPHPYLAEKWEISKDGLSVTLTLVKNALFHDKKPITSEDVAFSIMTVKALHPFKSMMASVKRVDTPNPYTVIIRLKKPHPAILLSMSPALLPILPKHIYGTIENVKNHPANMKPIGSGPFKLESFVPGKEIRLVKNDDFFIKGRPYLDRLTIKIIRNTLEESLGMETGDIQMMTSFQDLMELNHLQSLDHLVVIKNGFKGIGPIYWLAFNLRKKPFNDVRVRKAIAYAIDRKFIVDTTFKGEAVMETGPISSANPFYSSDVNLYEQDFEKANQLLDEAGYKRDKTGKRFSFRITYMPEKTGINQHITDYIGEVLLRNLGVEAIIEHPANFNEWIKNVSNWEFDVTMDDVFNWGDPVIGVHRTYLSSNIRKGVIWSNTQGYSNATADNLMEQAASELDFQKRYALYKQFQEIIVDELPVYSLFQPFFAIAYDKNLAGANQSIWGLMTPLDTVYWKQKSK
ncbi:MAG: ABC transporter substrate-binding protein [Proteobacteria bacterium]|nr:ABC transporter substrate-binding protein [Pseudomonadota bacterium]MBU1138342.1 ABC transporter substrate-binding protein [Pseudomonadota bacterium]MBU1233853.1 ABC transporter substrate-binding protein [Pseudomonadota bacterium]MBU1418945.1 ABC transporter substrate-binding protein [Pseudomonadota bacterium]MBU1453592.1 ABC transporter substrate-binding protein [Pseudomonadota bacterium]